MKHFLTHKRNGGQVSIEFALAMIVTLLMAYALIHLLNWSGRDLVDRSRINRRSLFNTTGTHDYRLSNLQDSRQLRQINTVTTPPTPFDGVWDGN